MASALMDCLCFDCFVLRFRFGQRLDGFFYRLSLQLWSFDWIWGNGGFVSLFGCLRIGCVCLGFLRGFEVFCSGTAARDLSWKVEVFLVMERRSRSGREKEEGDFPTKCTWNDCCLSEGMLFLEAGSLTGSCRICYHRSLGSPIFSVPCSMYLL